MSVLTRKQPSKEALAQAQVIEEYRRVARRHLPMYSENPGKQACYAMLKQQARRSVQGKLVGLTLPGEQCTFEKDLANSFGEVEIYLVEKHNQIARTIRDNFRDDPRFTVLQGSLAYGGIGRYDFDDIAERLNFCWLDYMGCFTTANMLTTEHIIEHCKQPALTLALTIGVRGPRHRHSPEETVETAAKKAGFRYRKEQQSSYTTPPGQRMRFLSYQLERT